jgi:tryptophan-rich sensory protein
VWTVLYVLMGVALAMVLSARGARGRGLAVAAFVVQLALNLAWSPVFFGLHRIALALGIIGAGAGAGGYHRAVLARVRWRRGCCSRSPGSV